MSPQAVHDWRAHGDEQIERVLKENLFIIYRFQWELDEKDDVHAPALIPMMATGRSQDGPIASSLSQPAAMALWPLLALPQNVQICSRATRTIIQRRGGW
jgi:hypothetical protein